MYVIGGLIATPLRAIQMILEIIQDFAKVGGLGFILYMFLLSITCLQGYACLQLLHLKSIGVRLTKILLLILAVYGLISFVISFLFAVPAEAAITGMVQGLSTIFISMAWYLYFVRSKRVLNTY